MKPIEFKEMNIVFGSNQPEYIPLPGHMDEEGVFTFCVELTEDEIIEMVRTRKLWLQTLTFNNPLQPVRLSSKRPQEFEQIEENKKRAAEIATRIIDEILDNYK